MGEVLLLRHGATEWSRNGRHTGSSDIPLLPDGERDARALAPWLASRDVTSVLVSPRRRARRTAELAGFGADVQQVTDDLAEWDYGDDEGITTREIHQTRPDWDLFRDGSPGGESPAQIGARVDRLLDRVRPLLADGDVALFGHGHALRVVGARWVGLEPSGGGLLTLDTGTICVLGEEHHRPVLHVWNSPPVHPGELLAPAPAGPARDA